MSLVIAGIISTVAVRLLAMPGAWDAVFTLLSMATVLALAILAEIARHRQGDYLGRLVTRLGRLIGRPLEASRVVRFVLDVEDVLLELLRGDRRRLIILTVLPSSAICSRRSKCGWCCGRSVSRLASWRRSRSIRLRGSAAWPRRRFPRASARSKRPTRRRWRCWGWVEEGRWRWCDACARCSGRASDCAFYPRVKQAAAEVESGSNASPVVRPPAPASDRASQNRTATPGLPSRRRRETARSEWQRRHARA